jgi:hypothetical protein
MEEKVTVPAIFISSAKIAEDIMKINAIKTSIVDYSKICKELKVNSDATEAKATEMLTDLNKVIKLVENKHKLTKDPYWQACKIIDNIKKDITGDAEKVVAEGRKKISDFRDQKRREEADAAQRALEEAQITVDTTAEIVEESIDSFTDQINNTYLLHNQAIAESGMTKDIEELKLWHMSYSNAPTTKFNTSLAPDFSAMVANIREQMTLLKDLRKAWFSQPARNAADWKNTQNEFVAHAEKLHQLAIKSIDTKTEVIGAKVVLQAAQIAVETKPMGRFRWEFVVSDVDSIPKEWLILDTAAVQNYIAENKEKLKDGIVINGVKFIQTEIVSFR